MDHRPLKEVTVPSQIADGLPHPHPPIPTTLSMGTIRQPHPPTSPAPRLNSLAKIFPPSSPPQSTNLTSAPSSQPTVPSTYLLHMASLNGDREEVKRLLAGSAAVNLTTSDGNLYTPLHCAAISGEANCVKQLLRSGAQLNSKDARGATPLHLVCSSLPQSPPPDPTVLDSYLKCARMLIKRGAKVSERDEQRRTPLHYAVLRGCAAMVSLLITHGTHIKRDRDGYTPYHISAYHRDAACLRALADTQHHHHHGSDNKKKSNTPVTHHKEDEVVPPLGLGMDLLAAQHANVSDSSVGSEATIKHINAKDSMGHTALHLVFLSQNPSTSPVTVPSSPPPTVALPLSPAPAQHSHNIQPETSSNTTTTPSSFNYNEEDIRSLECVQVLLGAGAISDLLDHDLNTPLHYAGYMGFYRCTEALLASPSHDETGVSHESGSHTDPYAAAAVSRRNRKGEIPLHLAASSRNLVGGRKCMKRMLAYRLPASSVPPSLSIPASSTGIGAAGTGISSSGRNSAGSSMTGTTETSLISTSSVSTLPSAIEKSTMADAINTIPVFDVNCQDNRGTTALHRVVRAGNNKAVVVLLRNGVSVNTPDNNGDPPLMYALHRLDFNICSMLVNAGADVSAVYKYGKAPKTDEVEIIYVEEAEGDLSPGTVPRRRVLTDRYGFSPDTTSNTPKWLEQRDYYSRLDVSNAKRDQLRQMKWARMLTDWGAYGINDTQALNNLASPSSSSSRSRRRSTVIKPTKKGRKKDSRPRNVGEDTDVLELNIINNYRNNPNPRASVVAAKQANHSDVAAAEARKTVKWQKLKERVRKGIPDSMRGVAWPLLVDAEGVKARSQVDYRSLLERTSDCLKQIDNDVNRTSRNHIYFRERYGPGQQALFNMLKAYSVYDPEVSYCQGMSSVAALLLMYLEEEEAFWVLVALMQEGSKYGLRGLFLPGFPKLYHSYGVHERLLADLIPDLDAHFKENDLMTSTYTTKWFLTLFLGVLPFPVQLRLWDILLSEGYSVVHTTAMAILKIHRKDLLKLNFEQLIRFFLDTETLQMDPDTLFTYAFSRNVPRAKVKRLLSATP